MSTNERSEALAGGVVVSLERKAKKLTRYQWWPRVDVVSQYGMSRSTGCIGFRLFSSIYALLFLTILFVSKIESAHAV